MSWLLILVLVFFVLMAVSGYKNGAVKTMLSLGVIVGALVIGMIAGPALKNVVCERSQVDEKMTEKIEVKMTESIAKEGDVEAKINATKFPKFIKKIILANVKGTNEAFEAGIHKGSASVSSMILVLAFSLVLFLVSWAVIEFFVHKVTKTMNLPVLKQLDGIAGILVSLIMSVLILDLGLLLLDCVSMTTVGEYLVGLIEKSKILSALNDKNIVAMIFNSFMAELEN